jgi:hypothetical protein
MRQGSQPGTIAHAVRVVVESTSRPEVALAVDGFTEIGAAPATPRLVGLLCIDARTRAEVNRDRGRELTDRGDHPCPTADHRRSPTRARCPNDVLGRDLRLVQGRNGLRLSPMPFASVTALGPLCTAHPPDVSLLLAEEEPLPRDSKA